jgi:TolB-like protein/Tfp pilus assembly protein PilF
VPALPLPDKPSIAVLPFANMSGDPEQEYFADGMVEEIITALSRIRWLFVIARNSSFTYKGQAVDVKQVGRELGVRYVLEGSVRKGGNRVRITAQLIEAQTTNHLWADRFDGDLADVFDLQDQVAGAVAGVIEPALQAAEIERVRRMRPDSLDAYDLYLRALSELRRPTVEGNARALALLHRVIEIDPNYAAAMAAVALCYVRRSLYQWTIDEDADTAEGTNLARAAIAAARDDATVLASASFALWNLNADVEAAVRTLDRAVELNPNLAIAWGYSGLVRAYAGDCAIAIQHCARAMRLSPLDPSRWIFLFGTGIAHLSERRLDDALQWLHRAREERPNFPPLLAWLASALAHVGRLEEARSMLQHLLVEAPRTVVALRRGSVFFKNAAVWAFILDGLTLAGLPEI